VNSNPFLRRVKLVLKLVLNLIDMGHNFAAKKNSEIEGSQKDSKSSQTRSIFWRSLALDSLVVVMPTVACLTVNTFSVSCSSSSR
jgi:hypothetical protein